MKHYRKSASTKKCDVKNRKQLAAYVSDVTNKPINEVAAAVKATLRVLSGLSLQELAAILKKR